MPTDEPTERPEGDLLPAGPAGRGKKEETLGVLAGDVEGGEGVARTVGDAMAILEGVLRSAPTTRAESAA